MFASVGQYQTVFASVNRLDGSVGTVSGSACWYWVVIGFGQCQMLTVFASVGPFQIVLAGFACVGQCQIVLAVFSSVASVDGVHWCWTVSDSVCLFLDSVR